MSEDIINRLRCRYPVGPVTDGVPEFGWKDLSGFAQVGMVLPLKVMLDAADELTTLRAQLAAAEARAERLLRGEFICQKCGLRKDSEPQTKGDF